MNHDVHKNYLRSVRKKLGLTQRQLGFLLGLTTGCRISSLENGRNYPTMKECIAFGKLFNHSLEELWPRWIAQIEGDLDYRIRKLMDRLQRSQIGSNRRGNRVEFILRRLETILEGLPEE